MTSVFLSPHPSITHMCVCLLPLLSSSFGWIVLILSPPVEIYKVSPTYVFQQFCHLSSET